jgi:hypothetical protein
MQASKIPYTIDKDGDFRIVPPQKTFLLYISIKSASELRFMNIYPNPIPPRKFAEALMTCNLFHQKTNYGRGYVQKSDDNDYYAVYDTVACARHEANHRHRKCSWKTSKCAVSLSQNKNLVR